ncbi:MAG: hypothetical protein HYY84_04040 [Deltaproteobacteria bacterium]|nr:hypothetical protein [Deltaproteobacteria bacterium]
MKRAIGLVLVAAISCKSTSSSTPGADAGSGAVADAGGSVGADAGADAGSAAANTDGGLWEGGVRVIRVYVAGESIERRNRYVAPPFLASGALNARDGGDERNDNDEYGWMVPLADRVALRDGGVRIEFVGAAGWLDADDNAYSGTYPSTDAGRTSAISGTDIPSWLTQREAELTARTHCYDVAFAARGGNDYGEGDSAYKENLKTLIARLLAGSSCQASPIVYVTGHIPDDNRAPDSGISDSAYGTEQVSKLVTRVQAAVSEFDGGPGARVRFVDMYTPFKNNQATTAFSSEVWSTGGVLDYDKIVRTGDRMHVRRLSSIYGGEIVADTLDLAELRALP